MSATKEYTNDTSIQSALRTASTVRSRWHEGARPNLAEVLESNPGLKSHRTVVIELAYDEYCMRRKAGETLEPAEFARRFRSFERSIDCYIAVQSLVDNDPQLAALRRTANWPEPGSEFLGFELLRELGRGAAGRVFLASQLALSARQVALKVTVEGCHEAEILGRLRHANIVPIYSIQEDDTGELSAFCMPYHGQATLAAVLDCMYAENRRPKRASAILKAVRAANKGVELPDSLPPDPILRRSMYVEGVIHLGIQLADALAHAHAQGIFHRDLKPSNILMAPDGRPLLLDFNLSVDDRSSVWRIGGTLPYMAPEELSALCELPSCAPCYDRRSDLFSLGVIFYELLAGKLPFDAIEYDRPPEEIAERLRKRQREGPLPLRQSNRQVDKRLARIVESCLAFDLELRPTSAESLAAALRKELSPFRRTRRWMVARRPAVLSAVLTVIVFVMILVAYLMLRPPYYVRQLREGLAYYEAGQDDLALSCFSAAIAADPRGSEALMARARVRQRQGNFKLAFADYESADRIASTANLDACEGYCVSQLGQDQQAAMYYRRALEAGDDSPALLNNLGYSWLRLGRLDDAEASLERALAADDTLQAAHHNLVLVYVARALRGNAMPPEAFMHARLAQELGPESGELCRDLAFFYALAAKQDRAMAQAAIACMAKALTHGIDPGTFRSDPTFSMLERDPAFQRALLVNGASRSSTKALRIIAPAG